MHVAATHQRRNSRWMLEWVAVAVPDTPLALNATCSFNFAANPRKGVLQKDGMRKESRKTCLLKVFSICASSALVT